MRQLVRFLAGHFAPHNSPTRERREVFFANGSDPNIVQSNENAETRRGGAEREQVLDTRQKTFLATPEITYPEVVKAWESPDLFRQVLRTCQITYPALAEEIRHRLGVVAGYDLSEIDEHVVPVELRHRMMAELLRKEPRLTLLCTRAVQERIDFRNELVAQIERRLSGVLGKKLPIQEKHMLFAKAHVPALKSLEQSLSAVPNGVLSELIEDMRTGKPLDTREIAIRLELLQSNQDVKDLPEKQRMLVQFLLDCKRVYKREWHLGDSAEWFAPDHTPSDDEYRARRTDELASLEKQRGALERYLDAQLSEAAHNVKMEHVRAAESLFKDVPTHKQAANVYLLKQRGYGYEELLDALNQHLLPADDLGVFFQEDTRRQKPNTEDFLNYAAEALGVLQQRLQKQEESIERLIEQKRRAQVEVEKWAHDTAQRLRWLYRLDDTKRSAVDALLSRAGFGPNALMELHDLFEPYALNEGERETLLGQHPEKRIIALDPDWTPKKQAALTALLTQCESNPEILEEVPTDPEVRALDTLTNRQIYDRVQETRVEVERVFEQISSSPYLQHEVCSTLGVQELLAGRCARIRDLLRMGKLRSSFALALSDLRSLQETERRLSAIKIEYDSNLGPDANAFFRDGLIQINSAKSADEQKHAEHHEKGHAVLWAMRAAFPFLLSQHAELLRERAPLLQQLNESHCYRDVPKQRDTWRDIARTRLEKRKGSAAYDEHELEEEADRVMTEKLFEELLIRHAEWVRGGRKAERTTSPSRNTELQLFQELDRTGGLISLTLTAAMRTLSETPRLQTEGTLFQRPEDEAADVLPPATPPAPEEEEGINVHAELREIERKIEMLQYFRRAYEKENPELADACRLHEDDTMRELRMLYAMFQNFRQNGQAPEDSPELIYRVKNLRKFMENITKITTKIDREQLDISQVDRVKKPGFFSNIRFLSLYDVAKLWNDIGEDLKTIYKRRQDRVLKDAGAAITDMLGVGGKLPYFGEYLANLRGYHERRYSGTDVEAANKWKESLKYVDSHAVLHLLEKTNDKDLLRGGIDLLVERGEMDWDATGIWKTFERLTGYKMPHEACLRDDVLRDTWLRKLIHALWNDKEQYFHWRQGNDSHIKSHKSEFTPMVDQFANVGVMAAELRKQLKLYVGWKEKYHAGIHEPFPDDVKPHLYEEVLHYAMRNGKMKMEEKFFYLIQGVRHGLLSIDRLRVLAGEGGEILLRFPFIDYFYQKNNSFPELDRLGKRLEEAGDPYTPGAKTMLFLQLEVPREQGFKERLSKALGRDNIEKIDHEDFPMIIGCVDYTMTENMIGLLSGERYKITKESAKNSYVGFNTKFKAYGRLADMEGENMARLTKSDAQSVAMSVAAFLHFDNLLTRNGWDGSKRLSVSRNDVENTSGPSLNGMNVKEFRDAAYAFIHRLLDDLERQGVFDWNRVRVSKQQYLQGVGALNEEYMGTSQPIGHQRAVYGATPKFALELDRALKARTDILKNTLKVHSDRGQTRRNYLMEEGATKEKEYLVTEEARTYFTQLRESSRSGILVH